MKGYPKNIATKEDFLILLAMPEHRDQALADLKALHDSSEDTMEIVKSYDTDEKGQMINVVTETVAAPLSRLKQMGFESREAVIDLHQTAIQEGRVEDVRGRP